jgi:hypothetical protein
MHRFALRGFVVIPALAALMILAAGCSSSGNSSPPKASPTATATHSSPAAASGAAAACQRIQKTLAQAPNTLGNLALHPSTAKPQVTAFIDKLKADAAAAGNSAVTSAVNDFTSSVQKALASAQSNPGSITSLISRLTNDSQRIAKACQNAG